MERDLTTTLSDLRVGHLVEPLAIPDARATFSWVVANPARGVVQESYRIRLRRQGDDAVLWDSGVVDSEATAGVVCDEELEPTERYEWELTVVAGRESATATASFGTGPDDGAWGEASWISKRRPATHPVDQHPAPCLRRDLTLTSDVARATLYVTAGGLFDVHVNGTRVTEADFGPGYTDYRYRVPFHALDVTGHLAPGDNQLDVVLGEGWFAGYYGPFGRRGYWGEVPLLRAILRIEHTDATVETIVTDGEWRAANGPVLLAEILHGQTLDRRLDYGPWEPVQISAGPTGRIVPARIPAAGAIREVKPISVKQPLPGTWIVDFGQNFAGRVRLTATGEAGTRITVRHAELLRPDGTLYTDNLRTARSSDTVVLAGRGPEEFEPRFTFHGFRYAEVTGYPGELTADRITGVVVSSVPRLELTLDTDDDLLNTLQRNLGWTLLSNHIEVPMDCPNRDERLGWGGDAHIFAPTAMLNADVEAFYRKWLDDIADAQKPNGAFADIAPGVIVDFAEEGAAGYADAGVFVPWDLHRHYGAPDVLAEFLDRGKAWLRFIESANPDLVWRNRRNADYGDWLSTVPTDKALTATAYWAHAAEVLADMAQALGRDRDAAGLRALHARISRAFRAEFVDADGQLRERTQTAYILALAFHLLEPDQIPRARDALVRLVETAGHLTSGFLAVRHAYPVLEEAGRPDLAFACLLRTERPSLGHQVSMGLTTLGEHWSAWDDDGELLDPYMNSFNHFALGSVFEWVYGALGGPTPIEPRFRRFGIAPLVDGPIGRVDLRFNSPSGPIATAWSRDDDGSLTLDLEVPANTVAELRLPRTVVHESGSPLTDVEGIADHAVTDAGTVVTVGSGSYHFTTGPRRAAA